MIVTRRNHRSRALATALSVVGLALASTSCGGGTGGAGSGDTLSGLVLVDFLQSGQDNMPLNRVLEFRFSSPLDPNTIGPASIQIREGPSFGQAVFGKYIIQADRVFFEPRLPGLCDLSDSGFHPNIDYRVTIIGSPEEFAIRNLTGDPLQSTVASSFHTRLDTDPELFEDQIPGVLPTVVSTDPVNDTAGVLVGPAQNNVVKITFSENLSPCTVNEDTILFYQYATGGPTGFFPTNDQTPGDPFTWGSGIAQVPPRRIRCTYQLQQDFLSTVLTMVPTFGEFPDNALLVVQVTNQVKDFGGNPMVPLNFSFMTENRPAQTKTLVGVQRRRADRREPEHGGGQHRARAEQGAGLPAVRRRRRQRLQRPASPRAPTRRTAPRAAPRPARSPTTATRTTSTRSSTRCSRRARRATRARTRPTGRPRWCSSTARSASARA